MSQTKVGFLALTSLLLLLAGCPSDDEEKDDQGDAGSAGAAGEQTGDDAGAPGDDGAGRAGSGGTTSTPSADAGGPEAGRGASDAGPAEPPDDGSGGSMVSPALMALCDDLVQLHQDKAKELACSGNDSEAQRRLCEVSGSCMTELSWPRLRFR